MNLPRSALFLSLALAPSLFAHAASSAEQRTRGAQVFADNGCSHCHTIRQKGGNKGPDLSGVGRRLNEDQIKAQILKGGQTMPPFAEVLQKSETEDLVAYLRSLRDKQKK
jgi:mono/diheme cytochrome c family protein